MPTLPSAPIAAAGLLGGYATARFTKNRRLGGAVLAAAGTITHLQWRRTTTPRTATALTATYLTAFGASHPLAKKLGAWPSVAVVTAATAGAAWVLSDRRRNG
ncbi:hypothetical protein STTU_2282 [Streptomyces sp. Tu6071]|uniref:hypothetical protein n=1 Tax=Streptomyces sp. Tu6071 TaxID=355249 RepID=UPI00020E56C3|nr:hypothetical protein [Streptomyces sp. Tu6071]EGJ75071.1 hypothetical protein STTU_2282 [Streptomyces sp. Tu6071]